MTWWIAENNPDLDKYLGVFEQLQKSSMVRLGCGMTLLPGDFKFPGVPLKTELATPDGRKIATTIISIKEQPLEEIDFTVPPGYRSLPKPSFGPNNP